MFMINKYLIYLILSLFLLAICITLGSKLYALFIFSSVFFLFSWLSYVGQKNTEEIRFDASQCPVGKLGVYELDMGDECFGLYLELFDHKVFMDLKEDSLLEERKKISLSLCSQSAKLEHLITKNNQQLLVNKEYKIHSLALHSENLNQLEIFWGGGEYTTLTISL